MIGFIRDPERDDEQAELGELLQLRAWQYALSSLDERLAVLGTSAGSGVSPKGSADGERIAYRVVPLPGGALNVEPMVQKRRPAAAIPKAPVSSGSSLARSPRPGARRQARPGGLRRSPGQAHRHVAGATDGRARCSGFSTRWPITRRSSWRAIATTPRASTSGRDGCACAS